MCGVSQTCFERFNVRCPTSWERFGVIFDCTLFLAFNALLPFIHFFTLVMPHYVTYMPKEMVGFWNVW